MDAVIETVWARAKPSDLLGASPNALAFDATGQAAIRREWGAKCNRGLQFRASRRGDTQLLGLIPVGWYPGAVAVDSKRRTLISANIKGLPKEPEKSEGHGLQRASIRTSTPDRSRLFRFRPTRSLPKLSGVVDGEPSPAQNYRGVDAATRQPAAARDARADWRAEPDPAT